MIATDPRSFLDRLRASLDALEPDGQAMPEPTPARGHQPICIGIATFDDPEGVWFTIQAIRWFHAALDGQLGFLILDNHPEGAGSADLKALENSIPTLRYVPFRGYRSTAVRDLIFREADADVVCCLDGHVLLRPGALQALSAWFASQPGTVDLLQGPLVDDSLLTPSASHLDSAWREGMYGTWGLDGRAGSPGGDPFEIEMQGLGLFACRREAWPGLNPRFRGFGGEEGYLHEKFRRRGGRVICHPELQWAHRFVRPRGAPYGPQHADMLRNYLIGWRELGWETEPICEHFREQFAASGAREEFEALLERTVREADSPLSYFDGIFCLNLDEDLARWTLAHERHERLGIAWQVERYPAVRTPGNHHRGCALSFRAMVAEARRREYEHVLILEDDAVFLDDTVAVMREVAAELPALTWDLCYLGGCMYQAEPRQLPGSRVLAESPPGTCTHAVAVHSRAYDRILQDVPSEGSEFEAWLEHWSAIDRYLYYGVREGRLRGLITTPRVASQPFLLESETGDIPLAARYTI